jgi:hypothetical protein
MKMNLKVFSSNDYCVRAIKFTLFACILSGTSASAVFAQARLPEVLFSGVDYPLLISASPLVVFGLRAAAWLVGESTQHGRSSFEVEQALARCL